LKQGFEFNSAKWRRPIPFVAALLAALACESAIHLDLNGGFGPSTAIRSAR
jgi:hypothetical protein